MEEYFQFAGAYGVIAGQVVDIESENSEPLNPCETLSYIHTHKTADLFKLSIRTGAIIADAGEKQLNIMTDYAQKLGFAFQIADDILDETSTFEKMGKTLGKDKAAGKLTYTNLYGLDRAKDDLNNLLDECEKLLSENGIISDVFSQITGKIRIR